MTGLIWFVQIVHYPLMTAVGTAEGCAYERAHTRRTGFVVGPLMLVEAGTAIAISVVRPDSVPAPLGWAGLALLGVIWLSTAAVQVPCHRHLERSFDHAVIRRLVRTNWLRTAAWTMRAAVAVAMLMPGLEV
ncbi:MAG: hypothetical protein HKO59_08390 [Phycisphaerales bacterium]|nr:hypothetical protein [Phycisphaerae bacterium]NNF44959.1 hypothetical protein [Phycisphaerales bacterium]NNM25988.1 hypothetical protein [Phycisphaerales bacterium]